MHASNNSDKVTASHQLDVTFTANQPQMNDSGDEDFEEGKSYTIKLTNLPKGFTFNEIESFLSKAIDTSAISSIKNQSTNSALVEIKDYNSAWKCVQKLKHKTFKNKPIYLSFASSDSSTTSAINSRNNSINNGSNSSRHNSFASHQMMFGANANGYYIPPLPPPGVPAMGDESLGGHDYYQNFMYMAPPPQMFNREPFSNPSSRKQSIASSYSSAASSRNNSGSTNATSMASIPLMGSQPPLPYSPTMSPSAGPQAKPYSKGGPQNSSFQQPQPQPMFYPPVFPGQFSYSGQSPPGSATASNSALAVKPSDSTSDTTCYKSKKPGSSGSNRKEHSSSSKSRASPMYHNQEQSYYHPGMMYDQQSAAKQYNGVYSNAAELTPFSRLPPNVTDNNPAVAAAAAAAASQGGIPFLPYLSPMAVRGFGYPPQMPVGGYPNTAIGSSSGAPSSHSAPPTLQGTQYPPPWFPSSNSTLPYMLQKSAYNSISNVATGGVGNGGNLAGTNVYEKRIGSSPTGFNRQLLPSAMDTNLLAFNKYNQILDPNYSENYDTINTKRLFFGNLSYKTSLETLKNALVECGLGNSDIEIPDPEHSKGYAIVTFATEEDAHRAIDIFNNRNFDGRRLGVRHDRFPGLEHKNKNNSEFQVYHGITAKSNVNGFKNENKKEYDENNDNTSKNSSAVDLDERFDAKAKDNGENDAKVARDLATELNKLHCSKKKH